MISVVKKEKKVQTKEKACGKHIVVAIDCWEGMKQMINVIDFVDSDYDAENYLEVEEVDDDDIDVVQEFQDEKMIMVVEQNLGYCKKKQDKKQDSNKKKEVVVTNVLGSLEYVKMVEYMQGFVVELGHLVMNMVEKVKQN